ncbi:MAG TPA: hypothetical protein ENJ50_03285, partial [Planctomycetaceae bacterium]|nr:hypothetical protein [Planctomycetaceae bacterium]
MHARSPASAVLSLVLAALIGSAAPSQKPAVNVLSAENQTAGMTRTGAKFGPTPVGGRRGSIALNRPGATHEKLAFARGKIPSVAAGGPDLYEIPILGIPHEHVQDIEPIGDWSKGAAYFAVTHSQDNSGHFFILKTKNVATAPNDHEIFDDPTRVDGEGVYYEKYHQFARAGQYNHPGDISAVGNILVIAAQNWPGSPFAKLQIGPKAAPDAVLFYDVVNPEKPKFLGKLPIAKIAPKLLDLSNLWAGKIGDNYYMSLGDGTRTFYFYSSEMSPSIAKWKPAIATGVGFRGDTILTLRIEGTSTPVNLSVSPAVDDYQVVDVSSSQAGAQLIFSGAVRSYDIADSAFKARGSASGDYVSKRGRMSQVSIDRGFRGLLIALESY